MVAMTSCENTLSLEGNLLFLLIWRGELTARFLGYRFGGGGKGIFGGAYTYRGFFLQNFF